QGVQFSDATIESRLRRIAGAVAEWRQALIERRWPKSQEAFPDPTAIEPGRARAGGALTPALSPSEGEREISTARGAFPLSPSEGERVGERGPPMLLEMERVLHLLSKSKDGTPEELRGFPLAPEGGAVVPDAFKNPEY